MTTYKVNYPLRPIRGGYQAKAKLAERMAAKYRGTHLPPEVCICYGCSMRRKWKNPFSC